MAHVDAKAGDGLAIDPDFLVEFEEGIRPHQAEIPSPLLWSDETVLRERFDERTWRLTWTTRILTFRYPYTPAGTAELFRAAYGPTVRVFAALDEDARASFAADLAAVAVYGLTATVQTFSAKYGSVSGRVPNDRLHKITVAEGGTLFALELDVQRLPARDQCGQRFRCQFALSTK